MAKRGDKGEPTVTGADTGKDFGALNMAKIPNIYRQPRNQPRRPFRPRRLRFRSSLLLVPLALLLAAWVLNRIRPSVSWGEIFYFLGVRNYQRASMVTVLALTLLAILLIKRILRRNRR